MYLLCLLYHDVKLWMRKRLSWLLIIALLIISAFMIGYSQQPRETTSTKQFSTVEHSKDGEQLVFKGDGVIITVVEPIKASTLSNGQPIRMATTITLFDPIVREAEKSVKLKLTQAIYNCSDLEAYVIAIIVLDENDVIVLKDLSINTIATIPFGSVMHDVRKHLCKDAPTAPQDMKKFI